MKRDTRHPVSLRQGRLKEDEPGGKFKARTIEGRRARW